jgi:hypothetical protein
MSAPRSLLDEVLPRFDANEVHQVWVPAPPPVVRPGSDAIRRSWLAAIQRRALRPAKRRESSVRRRSWL